MQPIGPLAVLNSSVDPAYDDTRSRPTQAQTFVHKATGAKFTFVIAHLKSKGSACAGDPDTLDGQVGLGAGAHFQVSHACAFDGLREGKGTIWLRCLSGWRADDS